MNSATVSDTFNAFLRLLDSVPNYPSLKLSQIGDAVVERPDQLIDRVDHGLDRRPVVGVVPLRLDLLVGLALLLDPGVVLQVVDPLAVVVAEFLDVFDVLSEQIAVIGRRRVDEW